MLQSIFIFINSLIFLLISVLHIYWAFGGKWAMNAVIPTKIDGASTFNPGKLATLIVAFGTFLFALVMVANLGYMDHLVNRKYIGYATIAIACIFFIRAIGDFKYAGFFKRIKDTEFARNDTRMYSPLCLLLSLNAFLIVFID